jgi:hypothetical protein
MACTTIKLSLRVHLKPAVPLHVFCAESSVWMFMKFRCSHSRREAVRGSQILQLASECGTEPITHYLSTLDHYNIIWRFSLAHGDALRVSTDAKRYTCRHLQTCDEQFFMTKVDDSFEWHLIITLLATHVKVNFIFHSFIHQWLYSPLLVPGPFFSFVISFTQTVGLLGRVISPSQGRYLHRTTQTQNNAHMNIHALNGIRTHDPGVRASEDSSCLRPRGHCDRQIS